MTEAARLLDSIDRRATTGKYAYAVMTLVAELGLRACDIIALKLTDIDWVNGNIKLVQSKTGIPVVLPLTERVWDGLKDYIRPVRKPQNRHSEQSKNL